MIDGLVLRWFITILFALAAAQCIYAMVRVRLPWQAYIGHALHLVMSVAMLVMAWPFSMSWPTVGPMVFFIIAAAWFLVSIVIPGGAESCGCAGECSCAECSCVPPTSTVIGRLTAGYHAAMMGAMAWMYAVMNGSLLPGHSGMSMPMAAGPGPMFFAHEHGDSGGGGGSMSSGPSYVEPINWIIAIGFLVAAAVWLYIYFGKVRAKDTARQQDFPITGDLCQAFMAAGMGIMFLTMVM